jgi:ketosteroid isomerase-like protein
MTRTVARIKNCTLILAILLLNSCASIGSHQAIHESYPKAQAELRKVIESIGQDAMAADIDALQAAHLDSDKFTKFGPRSFQRQNIEQTNKSEAAFFSSIKNLKYEAKDLKIDVFGDIGIATYYPHVSR